MDDGYEQTQALAFDDSGDETDEEAEPGEERPPVGYLKVLCQKGHPESSHPLYEGDNVIGRHDSCSIPLPFGSLSREHACIEVKGDSVFIYDKGSRNRTRRNQHFLKAEVRYELRDKDRLMFGDVDCVFEAYHKEDEGNDSGSETGSESMFETAPIDQELDEAREGRTLKLPADADYQSDASSDILEPTQPFGSQKQASILKNNNSTLVDQNQTHNVTVKDTPAPSRTKKITENLVLPESGSETDEEDGSSAAPTLAVESQQSEEEDDSPKRRAILGAATQAYVCESDDETEEEVTPKKKALLMAATQAYVEEEEEEDGDTPQKSLLTAATQAYVAESGDETGDEEAGSNEPSHDKTNKMTFAPSEDSPSLIRVFAVHKKKQWILSYPETPVKAKRAIIAEPTQAYTLAGGIEPTVAYDMDDDGVKELEESKALLYEPTQAYAGDVEDEDSKASNQGEIAKKSLMYEPTQAYPGKADDEDKDDAASETSEEFTLDDEDDKDNDEDVSHIFMAPTLACDDVEDSNQSEPSRDGILEMETQAVGEAETQAVGDDQTQVVDEKDAKQDDATQVFNEDAAQAIGDKSKSKKMAQADNDGETQVFCETQVLDEQKAGEGKERTGDEPTQMVPDETQVLDESPEKTKGGRASEEATQVFTDATLAVEEVEKTQKGKQNKTDNVDTDSEQATQVFPDATMAIEDLYHQNKVKKKTETEHLEDSSEAATQVFDDASVVKQTKRIRGKGQKKDKISDDSEAATQVFDEVPEPSVNKQNENKTGKGKKVNEEATQMFSQGIGEEDDSQRELIIRAVATLAAEENDEMDDTGSVLTDKKASFGSEDATQVIEGTVPLGEMETQPLPGGDASDTDAVTDGETVSSAETEPTLPVAEVIEKTKAKGRGRKVGKGKSKAETDTEAATQVFGDAETLPIAEIEEKSKARGRKASKAKVETDTSSEAATQVFTDTETLPIAEVDEKPKQKSRGRKAAKSKTETGPKAATNTDAEAATQVLDTTETLPISEIEDQEPKQRGRNRPAIPDMEPETQIYDDEKAAPADDEAVSQVLETQDAEDKPSRRSARSKKKDSVQDTKKAGPSKRQPAAKVETSKDKEATTELTAGTRSKGRRGKQASVEESRTEETKTKPASATAKKKGKPEEPVQEEATQAFTGEEATQRYGEEEKGLSIEDDDLTPPLSDEVVPDSEDAVTSPIIPPPSIVRIPSRSPHKSALASPGRKNSPSPKRVQFISQGSQEKETTTTTRGRRGKKVAMVTAEVKKDESDKKGQTQEKPTGRRGRRSVQIESKTAETDKVKPGRKSLPAVLETDNTNDGPNVSNENKLPKGRKGRNAKKSQHDAKDLEATSLTSKVDNSSEPIEKASETVPKTTGKRTTRGKAASEESVSDNKDKEVPEANVSENTASKRQSSRSKSRQAETDEKSIESSEGKKSRTKASKSDEISDKISDDTEIPETSHRTRNKVKDDSQESDVVTSKRGTRKTAIHENVKSDKSEKTAENNLTDMDKQPAKQQTKGGKSKAKSVSSESSETVPNSEHSKVTEELVDESSVRQPRVSRRKGKETESQDSQSNETKSNENKTREDTQVRTSKRKGRHDSPANQEQKSETTSKGDLKEITNLKNNKHVKDTKASERNKGKSETSGVVEKGKVTRGKIAGPASGSGDAPQAEPEHTPAKRRKTTLPESQTTAMTPKATSRRATIANGATSKQNAEKAAVRTPKGTKKLDNSLSSSPSLRKTDHTKPKVMFTGVTDEQCEKIVKELGGEMASSVYHCTHLVTDQVRRTVKFLCCLSRGIPICTPQWLMSSKRTSVFSDPSPFLIADSASEKKFKFSLQLSLDKANDKLFLADYKIHVTKSVKPDPGQMKDIIQCAGAKYLGSIPKTYSDQTVVISCEEDKAACDSAIKAGIPIVSSEFILTGALRQEADINSHRLFNGDKRKQSTAPDSEPSSKKRKK